MNDEMSEGEYLADMMECAEGDAEYYEEMLARDIWVCKDGTEIPVSQMKTSHLVNAINYISRNGEGSVYGLGSEWMPVLQSELRSRKP